mmetsp:Transcript_12299/g.10551  ORF Transcript_12299/g.10551 Transcript_12299/m.10551 type:complete len:121 (+) Transcript_12299:21-383(+)
MTEAEKRFFTDYGQQCKDGAACARVRDLETGGSGLSQIASFISSAANGGESQVGSGGNLPGWLVVAVPNGELHWESLQKTGNKPLDEVSIKLENISKVEVRDQSCLCVHFVLEPSRQQHS